VRAVAECEDGTIWFGTHWPFVGWQFQVNCCKIFQSFLQQSTSQPAALRERVFGAGGGIRTGKPPTVDVVVGGPIESDPNNAGYHFAKDNTLGRMGKIEDAADQIDIALSMDPNNLDYHSMKRFALKQLGRLDEIIDDFDVCITIDYGNPALHFAKGEALMELNRYEESLDEFNKSIGINSENPEYHEKKGKALKEMGRLEEARKEFDVAASLKGKHS